MPGLMGAMVALDAFSQALTNPLALRVGLQHNHLHRMGHGADRGYALGLPPGGAQRAGRPAARRDPQDPRHDAGRLGAELGKFLGLVPVVRMVRSERPDRTLRRADVQLVPDKIEVVQIEVSAAVKSG